MLKELIEKYYQEQRDEREQVKFYISDAGKCPRQIFFKFKKAPKEEMDPRILRIFERGDMIHEKLVRTLRSLGVLECAEIPVRPNEDISGRADAIVKIEGETYLVDFKSINSYALKNMKEPKEEHVLQVQLYLHFFKLEKGILLYEGKDDSNLVEFFIDYNKEMAEKAVADFDRLKLNIEQNLIPKQLADYPDNWQCSYCQFREICEITGPGNVAWNHFVDNIEEAAGKPDENPKQNDLGLKKSAREGK